jgi:hypothetical protein
MKMIRCADVFVVRRQRCAVLSFTHLSFGVPCKRVLAVLNSCELLYVEFQK